MRQKSRRTLAKKVKYGLKAVIHLTGLRPGESSLVADIAEANGELRNAGILHSKRKGRALHVGTADKIFVGEIVRTLDGPLAPIACASRNFYRPCNDCPGPPSP